MNHPALTYRQLAVQGATPLGLVVMLYDGAIAALHRALAAIEAHDVEKKCHHLGRALAIIVQLEGTLNFERGGEVAQTLRSFYVYARAQAMKANLENSAEILRSLIENFATLREAWQEGERRLATRNTSLPANGGSAKKELRDAGSVGLSVFD
jgi:flagellar protein FliS